MQNVLAVDLTELHQIYPVPATILAKVREYYEERDKIGALNDRELFQHAITDYCAHAPDIERETQEAYADYCLKGTLPLKVVRCLLPNKLDRGSKK